MPKRYLIFDMHNILHRCYFVALRESAEDINSMVFHSVLFLMKSYHTTYAPDSIILAFDSGESWRTKFTRSEDCVSQKVYKDHRRKGMTPTEKANYKSFIKSVGVIKETMDTHTKLICISRALLEADDIIASFTFNRPDDEKYIVSSDGDMLQLLRVENTTIVDPSTQKPKYLTAFNDDPIYFLFEKCIRGDKSDNVQSAFPGVRKTRIQKAFTNNLERVNLMNETWTGPSGETFCVGDLFEENKLLMDLAEAPEMVRDMAKKVVDEAMGKDRKYSHFNVLKFLGQNNLKNISRSLDNFASMFNCG